MMILAGIAVILYGLLTVIGCFVLAVFVGAPLAAFLAVVAAAATYVYQAMQLQADPPYPGYLKILFYLPWILTAASLGASLIGA